MWANRCSRVRSRLPLLAGGELIGPERRLVERHLLSCAPCRDRLAQHRRAIDALHTAADVSPTSHDGPSLWPALARQIQESRRTSLPIWERVQPRSAAWASAALAASLLVTIGAVSLRQTLFQYKVEVVKVGRSARPKTRYAHSTRVVSEQVPIHEAPSLPDTGPSARHDEDMASRTPSPVVPEARNAEPTH